MKYCWNQGCPVLRRLPREQTRQHSGSRSWRFKGSVAFSSFSIAKLFFNSAIFCTQPIGISPQIYAYISFTIFHEIYFSLQIIDQQNAINFPRGFGNWPNIQNLEVNRILVVLLWILNKHQIFLQKDNLERKLMRRNRHAGQIVQIGETPTRTILWLALELRKATPHCKSLHIGSKVDFIMCTKRR